MGPLLSISLPYYLSGLSARSLAALRRDYAGERLARGPEGLSGLERHLEIRLRTAGMRTSRKKPSSVPRAAGSL